MSTKKDDVTYISTDKAAMLYVTVHSGKDLKACDSNGYSDPFVKLSYGKGGDVERTKTKKKTLNPDWQEQFVFPVTTQAQLDDNILNLRIFDFDRFGANDEMGEVSISCKTLTPWELNDAWYPVSSPGEGQIRIQLYWAPQVQVGVMEARNLIAADSNGSSDPYCTLQHRKRVVKSTVVKKTLKPKWSFQNTFGVTDKLDDFWIEVFDKDTFSKDDPLGKYDFWANKFLEGEQKVEKWVPLKNGGQGEILLKVSYFPKSSCVSSNSSGVSSSSTVSSNSSYNTNTESSTTYTQQVQYQQVQQQPQVQHSSHWGQLSNVSQASNAFAQGGQQYHQQQVQYQQQQQQPQQQYYQQQGQGQQQQYYQQQQPQQQYYQQGQQQQYYQQGQQQQYYQQGQVQQQQYGQGQQQQ